VFSTLVGGSQRLGEIQPLKISSAARSFNLSDPPQNRTISGPCHLYQTVCPRQIFRFWDRGKSVGLWGRNSQKCILRLVSRPRPSLRKSTWPVSLLDFWQFLTADDLPSPKQKPGFYFCLPTSISEPLLHTVSWNRNSCQWPTTAVLCAVYKWLSEF